MSALQARTDAVVAYLRTTGKDIGQRAREGDATAANIVTLYAMFHRAPDPATLALLESAVDDWKREAAS